MSKLTNRSLLAVVAHPDDETFGCGGLLARYAAEGVRVTLVCATRGEAGEISDASLASSQDLGRVREQELRAACDVLGVKELFILGYRDSGMASTPDNRHPNALSRASRDEVVGRIAEVVRRVRPQAMVTFEPGGGYGHPDHIAIHHAAREAFAAAGDPARYPEQLAGGLDAHRPSKLYYFCFPRSMARAFHEAIKEAGIESDFNELDPETLGVPDEEITTVVDVGRYSEVKERAARCHRTQISADGPFSWLPESLRARVFATEHLIRAEPPFVPGRDPREEDLFAGIQASRCRGD